MPELTGPIQGDPTTLLSDGVSSDGVLSAPAHPIIPRIEGGGQMHQRHLGWIEAADPQIVGIDGADGAGAITCDTSSSRSVRLMAGAREVKSSEFGQDVISHGG